MESGPLQDPIERRASAEIRITRFLAQQIRNSTTYFGYPEVPENNDLSILGISGIAKLHLNNAGDPSIQGNAKMHTKEFEVELLEVVAELYGIGDNHWGYVTSGGTEGNLYGAYMGREYFARKKLSCVYLFSSSSHYSVPKNARLLNLDFCEIKSMDTGEIDYDAFEDFLSTLKESGNTKPGIILNLNIGTTMKGAVDDLSTINGILTRSGFSTDDIFIHADAALMGFIYPFTKSWQDLFEMGVSSIAISGHKFLGAIHPCGIFMARKDHHQKSFDDRWISYVGTSDTTISGSRNGFLALNLWYLLFKKGIEEYRNEALTCIANAEYLYDLLKTASYPETSHFPDQTIVTFRKPTDKIVKKYQLATEGDLAHVVVMQHVTRKRIEAFSKELLASRS